MKRHQSLQDLSRDHHHFLLQSRQISWLMAGDRRAPPFEFVVQDFLRTWEREVVLHLEEEEQLLWPSYQQYPSPTQASHETQMWADHEWLRAQVAELARRKRADEPLGDLLGQIGQRLHDHVRFEERIVFQHMQQMMSVDALDKIGAASEAFRLAHRPNAIGSRRDVCEI
ncbi:MAG: hemerythrin domain-containing protein [Ardenticatenaceae bacterium]